MTVIASSKIFCPNDTKNRHEVALHKDGSVTCGCADGRERGSSYAGRLLLGMPPIQHARGCAVLAALVDGAETLLPIEHSMDQIFGPWTDAVQAYRSNPVFRAALDIAAAKQPERTEIYKLVLASIESCGYKHKLGSLDFRARFRVAWDVPATTTLDRTVVSAFDDDAWRVPYQPGWKTEIFDKKLAVIDGRFICGRSNVDPTIFYAICRYSTGGHWVRIHRLIRKKLYEVME